MIMCNAKQDCQNNWVEVIIIIHITIQYYENYMPPNETNFNIAYRKNVIDFTFLNFLNSL